MRIRGVTIDDPHSTDLDDAVWAEADGDKTKVFVTIACAAERVPLGSELDVGAKTRVVTRYYAAGHSSMLPRGVEEKLSLLPGLGRRGVTVELTFNESNEVVETSIQPRKIESLAKLSYADITTILATPGHVLRDPVQRLMAVSSALLGQRRQRGALVLYDLNHGWVATEDGHVKKLERAADAAGHILVQELMIAANVAVAQYAIKHEIPVLYRNHQAVGGGPDRAPLLTMLDEAVRMGNPVAWLEEARRSLGVLMHRAEYGAEPAGHFGLNLPYYLHFTSPIRRYADLVTQRQVLAHIVGVALPYSREEIAAIAAHINSTLALHRGMEEAQGKERATKAATAAIDNRKLDGLNAKEFERVTKVVARSGEDCPEAFGEAFTRRLADHRVPLICKTIVLLERTAVGTRWTELRQAVVAYLAQHPWEAVSVLAMAKDVLEGAPAPAYDAQSGPAHAPHFTATATMGEECATETGRTKKEATQRAAIVLVARLAGVSRPQLPMIEAPPTPSAAPQPAPVHVTNDGRDPIAALGEHAQAQKRPMPVYSFVTEGERHAPVFACTCTFEKREASGKGSTKQEAKRAAAAEMLVLLPSPC